MKAFEKGKAAALYNVGILYYSGLGSLERDLSVAAKYFEQYISMEPEDAEAIHLLGRCYAFMEDRNLEKAEALFSKSASLGNKQAAKDLDALQLGGSIVDIY